MVVISTVMRLVSRMFIAFRAEGLFAGGTPLLPQPDMW